MGFFSGIRNDALIRELESELNTDILLFGVDGFTYFGNLQKIECHRVAILTPAIVAESPPSAEILTPGGGLVSMDFLRVDLCSIIAKGTGIVEDPLANDDTIICEREEGAERQENHEMIRQLRRMIGGLVTMTTLGGFLFEGVLGDLCNGLAILRTRDIYVPGASDPITDDSVRSVVVNLAALTSVSTLACC